MSFLPNNYSPIEVSIPDENGNLVHFEGNITSTIPGIAAPELKDFIDVPINWGSDAIFDDMKFVDLPFVNIGDFNIKIDSVNPDEIMKTIPDLNQEKKSKLENIISGLEKQLAENPQVVEESLKNMTLSELGAYPGREHTLITHYPKKTLAR